jgi:putative tricarboxylic transport membrane protein
MERDCGLILLVIGLARGRLGADQARRATSARHGAAVLSAAIALIGVILVGIGLREGRTSRDRWPLRGPVFILGSAVAFGLAIRPLGLAVAGPLLVIVGAFASDETRWIEVILFAVGMTVFCVVLFKYLLSLPIPLAPWLIGY